MSGYSETVAALEAATVFGIHPSLDTITSLCEALGRPQDAFRVIQVAGTNGKSSVARMCASVLHGQGLRAGCFTSPHLDEYVERIEVDGEPIAPHVFSSAFEVVRSAVDRSRLGEPTEFELLTAMALVAFREAGIEVAVLEVGMGGRWDATSVAAPVVAVVTGVALDHMEHLGSTREAIAADKAHIIGRGTTAVLGGGTSGVEDVFIARAREVGGSMVLAVREMGHESPVPEDTTVRFEIVSGPDTPRGQTVARVGGVRGTYTAGVFAPRYQAANMATAIAAVEAMTESPLDSRALATTLEQMRFPARFEIVSSSPLIIADGSHNPEAAHVLATAIEQTLAPCRPSIVLGVLADKDAAGIVRALARVAGDWYVTGVRSTRSLSAERLGDIVREQTGVRPVVAPDSAAALRLAIEATPCAVVGTGSLVTAAEVRQHIASGLFC